MQTPLTFFMAMALVSVITICLRSGSSPCLSPQPLRPISIIAASTILSKHKVDAITFLFKTSQWLSSWYKVKVKVTATSYKTLGSGLQASQKSPPASHHLLNGGSMMLLEPTKHVAIQGFCTWYICTVSASCSPLKSSLDCSLSSFWVLAPVF